MILLNTVFVHGAVPTLVSLHSVWMVHRRSLLVNVIIAMLRLLMCRFQQHGFVFLLGFQPAVQEEEDSGGF